MNITTLKRQELKYYINFIDYFSISNILYKIFSKDPNNDKNSMFVYQPGSRTSSSCPGLRGVQ